MAEVAEPLAQVLVVEDDQSVREMLSAVLRREGYDVLGYADAESALEDDRRVTAAAAVLDVGLPGLDGIALCRRLRASGRVDPILMLTARHEVADRVEGLDAGADDYLVKPFALDELLARVRAMVRRAHQASGDAPRAMSDADLIIVADVELNVGTREVRRAGRSVDLTKIEFDLLSLLMCNSPLVLSREVIYERIWGYDQEHGSNTLEVFVSQLRRKLGGKAPSPGIIATVRGVGYAAREPE